MKKILLAIALIFSLGLAETKAGVPDINAVVKEAFQKQFPAATEAEWSSGSNYYKVSFLYYNNYVDAYYSFNGEFLATIRNITSVNLPMMLQTSLKNDYTDYWVSDLYELAKPDGSSYYVTLENADQKIVLKSSYGTAWVVHKKSGKV